MNTFINQLTEEVLNEAFDIKSIANAFFAKHPGLLKQVKNMCGSFKPDIKLNKADYNIVKELYINNDADKAKQLIKGLYKPQDKKYSYLMSMTNMNEAVSKKLLGLAFMLALSSGLLAGCSIPTGYEEYPTTVNTVSQPEEETEETEEEVEEKIELTIEQQIEEIKEIMSYYVEHTSIRFDESTNELYIVNNCSSNYPAISLSYASSTNGSIDWNWETGFFEKEMMIEASYKWFDNYLYSGDEQNIGINSYQAEKPSMVGRTCASAITEITVQYNNRYLRERYSQTALNKVPTIIVYKRKLEMELHQLDEPHILYGSGTTPTWRKGIPSIVLQNPPSISISLSPWVQSFKSRIENTFYES